MSILGFQITSVDFQKKNYKFCYNLGNKIVLPP